MNASPPSPAPAAAARAVVARRLDALVAGVRSAEPADREAVAVRAAVEVGRELARMVVDAGCPEALDPRAALLRLADAAWPGEGCPDRGEDGEPLPPHAQRLVEAVLGPGPSKEVGKSRGELCVDCRDGVSLDDDPDDEEG